MAARKRKVEDGVDPVVVSHVEDYDDSDTDMEGLPAGASDPDSEDEAPEEIERKQTVWAAGQALRYYNDKHQDVEYALVNPLCSTGYFVPRASVCHCLFTAKKVSSSSSSSSSEESSPPTPSLTPVGSSPLTPKVVSDGSGSSSTPSLSSIASSPVTPKVVSDGSGSSSSNPSPSSVSYGSGDSLTLTPDEELFFAEAAMHPWSKEDELTVHCCVILNQRGPVPRNIGCFYCSKSDRPFYHPPEELLKFSRLYDLKFEDDDVISD